ncbi:MAG: hypothetical protein JWN78_2013 [Bacteroidota bacterium]|nr:hypothetical protein [Bacteroidota bacterium]
MKNTYWLTIVIIIIFLSSCTRKLDYEKNKSEYDLIVNCLLKNYPKLYDSIINTPLKGSIYTDDLKLICKKCNFKVDNVMDDIESINLYEDTTIAFYPKCSGNNIILLIYSSNPSSLDIRDIVLAKYDNRYKAYKQINSHWLYIKGNIGMAN